MFCSTLSLIVRKFKKPCVVTKPETIVGTGVSAPMFRSLRHVTGKRSLSFRENFWTSQVWQCITVKTSKTMRKFADPKKPGGLCFTYNLIDKRKISVLSEKSVGVETPTYGDYRLSSNRKVSKRTFFVLTEKTTRAETPTNRETWHAADKRSRAFR